MTQPLIKLRMSKARAKRAIADMDGPGRWYGDVFVAKRGLRLRLVRCRRGDHPGFSFCAGWRTETVYAR